MWSWMIFQPLVNLPEDQGEQAAGLFAVGHGQRQAPRTRATSGPRGSISIREKATLPIALPSALYRFRYRSAMASQPSWRSPPDWNTTFGDFQ